MLAVDKTVICKRAEGVIMPEIRLPLRQRFRTPPWSVCWWPTMSCWGRGPACSPLPGLLRGLGGRPERVEWKNGVGQVGDAVALGCWTMGNAGRGAVIPVTSECVCEPWFVKKVEGDSL